MVNPDKLFGRLGNRMFQMAYVLASFKEGNIPDWFLQDPSLFEKHADYIRSIYSEGIGLLPYTAIHLRVGKNPSNSSEPAYKDNPFYTQLHKTRYYADAFSMFPQDRFIVFSDDLDFAREYFQGDRFGFDESTNDVEALNKMASCQNLIIANSSFSWWAAFLCPHAGRTIVCPPETKWYQDGVVRTRVPTDWFQLDFPYPQENEKNIDIPAEVS